MNQPNETPTLDGSFPRRGIGNPAFTEEYANDTLRTLFERRTIRRYTDEPVGPHDLDVIVDAGLRAANAGGCQAPIMLVSQDREVNQRLGRISNDLYDEGYYPVSAAQPSTACEVGITNAFYNAPVVITVFTPAGWSYAPLDAAVCAANMMNAAWSSAWAAALSAERHARSQHLTARRSERRRAFPMTTSPSFMSCWDIPRARRATANPCTRTGLPGFERRRWTCSSKVAMPSG